MNGVFKNMTKIVTALLAFIVALIVFLAIGCTILSIAEILTDGFIVFTVVASFIMAFIVSGFILLSNSDQ